MKQALLAAWRHFLLLWGDRRSSLTGLFMTVVTAVINGSAFYMAPKTSTGSFMKGGGIFFSLIYFFLNALPQLSSTVTSRSILAKQHRLGFIHPLALTLGLTLADLPLALLEVTAFSLPYYFLLGLRPAAGAFLTFLLTLFLAYAAALSLFRALGAWSPNASTALLVGGAALPVLLAYSGYAPPVPTMPGWGAWIRRVSPSPWALEALLANEFAGIELHCSDNQLVPSGAGDGEQLGDPAATSAFTFENVTYTIVADGQEKQLLDGVTGIVRPGQLTALMVVDYFARHGAVMGEFENPAEFIINTATSKDDPSKDWARTWSESPENQELHAEISEYKSTSSSAQGRDSHQTSNQAFALPLKDQIIKVTQRHWISVWRDGPYNFSKLFKSIFCELFIAFTFFHSDTTLQGTQNRMLFFLLISWLVPAIVPDIQAVWFEKRAIHAAREKNGVYSTHALTAALVLVELPWQLLNLTIVFLCIYWTVGYPSASSVAGYEYLMFLLLGVFGTGFAQVVAALFPREKTAGYANSLAWVVLTAFTGAAIPHAVMTDFYRPWMFWVDPLRYFVSGSVANVLRGTPVEGFGGICGILCQ
ncbi:putative abc multidrug protein [Neofusicoccum parvum UCRNP2]|uniref:Putative abc multidrug protein n=1 Tax=Botryosphaeria parva (strain UCR-NP2) TaxID=1287680 RepID=R1EBH6_BOTPV|nr:putative abc multidrug protein [Neofusicoccum parvum UCRNP2]